MRHDSDDEFSAGCGLLTLLGLIAAWLTHVIFCIGAGKWGFLIAGAIFFPIGIIHGVMIWFGHG